MNMTKATKELETIDSFEQLGTIVEEGLTGIKMRGKAEFEDKTMIDVWQPVAEALKKGELTKDTIEAAKEHTKELVAKKGRASYVGERAIGHIDPGSASSAILFDSLLTVIEKN
ncbi:MAG TPA: DAK2 domain-containing protein, partial [Enterococcus casseliflavus]|nr:DAK2 domain-containing protein [Enterococcus casseliflavus]